jgi:hypothetical protein
VRANLFADVMDELGLDPTHGAYIDRLPGVTLATGNLVSFFGRSRGHPPVVVVVVELDDVDVDVDVELDDAVEVVRSDEAVVDDVVVGASEVVVVSCGSTGAGAPPSRLAIGP